MWQDLLKQAWDGRATYIDMLNSPDNDNTFLIQRKDVKEVRDVNERKKIMASYKLLVAPLLFIAGSLAASYVLDTAGYPDHAKFARQLMKQGVVGFSSRLLFD